MDTMVRTSNSGVKGEKGAEDQNVRLTYGGYQLLIQMGYTSAMSRSQDPGVLERVLEDGIGDGDEDQSDIRRIGRLRYTVKDVSGCEV